jgi:hypothetical protein
MLTIMSVSIGCLVYGIEVDCSWSVKYVLIIQFLYLLGINHLFERSNVVEHQETQAFLLVETNQLIPLFTPLFFLAGQYL